MSGPADEPGPPTPRRRPPAPEPRAAGGPDWAIDGRDWPNRAASRFLAAGGSRWHVQVLGQGPTLLLLHGTGAATHSWRGLAPLLAQRFTIVAADLPGHGFTAGLPAGRSTLPGMALAVGDLLDALGLEPGLAVGHSAGAAILLRMALDGRIAPQGLVALNGALLPFRGVAGQLFSPLAKVLVANPFLPRLFSWGAGGRAAVERLVADTGSRLDERGLDLYGRLLRHPEHVAGALRMMAHWDLKPLERDLPRLAVPLLLAVGQNDRAVAPAEARRVRDLVPGARVMSLGRLGHLAHEEDPEQVARVVTEFARTVGIVAR